MNLLFRTILSYILQVFSVKVSYEIWNKSIYMYMKLNGFFMEKSKTDVTAPTYLNIIRTLSGKNKQMRISSWNKRNDKSFNNRVYSLFFFMGIILNPEKARESNLSLPGQFFQKCFFSEKEWSLGFLWLLILS